MLYFIFAVLPLAGQTCLESFLRCLARQKTHQCQAALPETLRRFCPLRAQGGVLVHANHRQQTARPFKIGKLPRNCAAV